MFGVLSDAQFIDGEVVGQGCTECSISDLISLDEALDDVVNAVLEKLEKPPAEVCTN